MSVKTMSDDAQRRVVSVKSAAEPRDKVTRLRHRRSLRRGGEAGDAGATEADFADAADPAGAAAEPRSPEPRSPEPGSEGEDKIVHIVRRLDDVRHAARRRRVPWVGVSALLAILLPTLLVGLYYLLFAVDRYVAEARFAVRSNEAQTADVLGMIAGMPKATVVSDSYIVIDYIRSREMVQDLEERLPLRAIYASPQADFLTRLDPDASLEGLVDYWNERIEVFYDATKGTIAVEVEAFAGPDAQRIVEAMVEEVRTLINDLSAQSRRDAVQFAAQEVARAELRIRGARQDLAAFRAEEKEFDPAQTASASLGIIAQLEGERSQLNSQLAAIGNYLSDAAPSVQMLKTRIAAIETEINRMQGQISATDTAAGGTDAAGTGAAPLSSALMQYQELLLNQEFAENAYTAALASQERARADAERTQSYLAIFVHPRIPEQALYPYRLFNTFVALIVFAAIWAVGALLTLTIKDHIR